MRKGDETIVDKYGGMNNASAYIGLIPERKIGVIILTGDGDQAPPWDATAEMVDVIRRGGLDPRTLITLEEIGAGDRPRRA